ERNLDEPLLIDANFSTIWSSGNGWTGPAIKALLNSSWCELLMETVGTPMGGGALKLEAAHLKNLPIPLLSEPAKQQLHAEGIKLDRLSSRDRIDAIVLGALCEKTGVGDPLPRAKLMAARAQELRRMRQRTAA